MKATRRALFALPAVALAAPSSPSGWRNRWLVLWDGGNELPDGRVLQRGETHLSETVYATPEAAIEVARKELLEDATERVVWYEEDGITVMIEEDIPFTQSVAYLGPERA